MRIISARCSICGRSSKCRCYATPFSAALIEAKCAGEPGAPKIPVTVIERGSRFKVGPSISSWSP